MVLSAAPLFLTAKVWHYWVAFPLVAAAVIGIVALVGGYLAKVTSAKYPRR
jgi:hypothetical protein